MVEPTLVCSSFLLSVPCFFTRQKDIFILSGVTCITSILYWSDIIPRIYDILTARVCCIYYLYKNLKSEKNRTLGFTLCVVFSSFYILSVVYNSVIFHVLFHISGVSAQLCVVFDPLYYQRTRNKSKSIWDKLCG